MRLPTRSPPRAARFMGCAGSSRAWGFLDARERGPARSSKRTWRPAGSGLGCVPEQHREEVRLPLWPGAARIARQLLAAGNDLRRQRPAAEGGRHAAVVAVNVAVVAYLPPVPS